MIAPRRWKESSWFCVIKHPSVTSIMRKLMRPEVTQDVMRVTQELADLLGIRLEEVQ